MDIELTRVQKNLMEQYNLNKVTARIFAHIHHKVKNRNEFAKWTTVILSSTKSSFADHQRIAYEVFNLGPREEAYKLTINGSYDLTMPLACWGWSALHNTTNVFLRPLADITDYLVQQIPYADKIYNNLFEIGLLMIAEHIVVSGLAYTTKKPWPRLSGLVLGNVLQYLKIANTGYEIIKHAAKKLKGDTLEDRL